MLEKDSVGRTELPSVVVIPVTFLFFTGLGCLTRLRSIDVSLGAILSRFECAEDKRGSVNRGMDEKYFLLPF